MLQQLHTEIWYRQCKWNKHTYKYTQQTSRKKTKLCEYKYTA